MDALTPVSTVLPEDYLLVQRIRDLWANYNSDDEIRSILGLTVERWHDLIRIMKEANDTEGDNRVAYEKFIAKQSKRAKELERLRLYAEGQDELGTAVKCFQLESDIDRSFVEMAVKLGVVQGEVVTTNLNVKHDIRLQALFADLSPEKKIEAKEELKNLTQALIAEGITLTPQLEEKDDTGKGTGTKR